MGRRSSGYGRLPLKGYRGHRSGLGRMYETGEGVPESNAMAAGWYRKAADHFRDVAGV
jgi:TPR repeat protein